MTASRHSLMVCHHLLPGGPRVCRKPDPTKPYIAAEDVLHDMGAISMIGSDSQAMGRCRRGGAHLADARDGAAGRAGDRLVAKPPTALNYIAKYTHHRPAIAHGIDHLIGSVEVGKLADLCCGSRRFRGFAARRARWGDRLGSDGRCSAWWCCDRCSARPRLCFPGGAQCTSSRAIHRRAGGPARRSIRD